MAAAPITTDTGHAAPARQPRRRSARGPARPQYLRADDVDKLLHVVMALMSEVSSLRDRLDTHELLAAAGVSPTTPAVEAHGLDAAQRDQREQRRRAMLKRSLRVLIEEAESSRAHRPDKAAAHDAGFDQPVP